MKAIFPGSFDPFHEGHEFIINKALNKFDFIYIVISKNEEKKRYSSFKDSFNQIKKILKNNKKIKILINEEKLTVEIANELNCFNIIRGIRNKQDLIYEKKLRKKYQNQDPRIKIFYFFSNITTSSTEINKVKKN